MRALGILLTIVGYIVIVVATLAMIAWGVMDIIGLANGTIAVTFGSILWVILKFAFREVIGLIVGGGILFIGLLLTGKKRKHRSHFFMF